MNWGFSGIVFGNNKKGEMITGKASKTLVPFRCNWRRTSFRGLFGR